MKLLENIFSVKNKEVDNKKYLELKILGIKFKKKLVKNNFIYIVKDGKRIKKVRKIKGLKINFNGCDSIIEIGCNPIAKFENCEIECIDNSYIKIGSSCKRLRKLVINSKANGSHIEIGNNVSVQSAVIINENEPNLSVTIGDDCMLSHKVYLRPTDAHTIYDIKTKQILNNPKSIKIGNHVWIARDVKVLKGANIPDNFIVGANSVVTSSSIKNVDDYKDGGLLVGVPAKVVKTGVNWDSHKTSDFERNKYNKD